MLFHALVMIDSHIENAFHSDTTTQIAILTLLRPFLFLPLFGSPDRPRCPS